jgi:hypothetical protein
VGCSHQGAFQDLGPLDIGPQVGNVVLIDHSDDDGHLTGARHRLAIAGAFIHGDGWPEDLAGLETVGGNAIGIHKLQELVHEQLDHPRATQAGELASDEADQGLA